MSGALPRLGFWRAALAPAPDRWQQAVLTAAACAVAVGVVVSVQIGSFVAPAMAYMAMQPTVTCTWRNLVRRVLTCGLAMIALVHLGGIAVQLPWLLLPLFFVEISAVSYFVSLTSRPMEAMAVMYAIVMVHFTGVFTPRAIGTVALEVWSAYAIGSAVGTLFAQLAARERPHQRLAMGLIESFGAARARLAAIVGRYLDADAALSPPAPAPALAAQLGLFQLVRQQELGTGAENAFLAFLIAAERVQLGLSVADSLTAERTGRHYRALIAPELRAVAAALDGALAAFAAASAALGDAGRDPASPSWPDLAAPLNALEARQMGLRRDGTLAGIEVGEGANTNAFVQTLRGLADVMHVPPDELARSIDPREAQAAAPLWPTARRFDPYAARWALQIGLGVTLTFVLVVVSHVPALFTALWNPLFIAQQSYGATLRRAGLRIAGVVAGGLLAVLSVIAVMPNITSVSAFALLVFAVILPCQYVALGGPRVAYAGMQTAFTYMIVLVANQPTADISTVLWRAFGTLLGTGCLFLSFRVVAPDYAGRQLVARLRDVLRAILTLWPAPGTDQLTSAHLLEVRRDVGTATADVLRLAEEARIEGAASGVAPAAAVEAAGLASRIAHRSVLIHRARLLTPWPPLPAATRNLLVGVEAALHERLLDLLHLLDARHTMAPAHTRAHLAARAAAAALAGAPRREIDAPVRAFTARLDATRATDLAQWPVPATTALFAELDHLARVGQLLPRLESAVTRAVLPD